MRLKPERVTAPPPRTGLVYAVTDMTKGNRIVRKGDGLPRDNVMVLERPDLFEVRNLLTEEVNDG